MATVLLEQTTRGLWPRPPGPASEGPRPHPQGPHRPCCGQREPLACPPLRRQEGPWPPSTRHCTSVEGLLGVLLSPRPLRGQGRRAAPGMFWTFAAHLPCALVSGWGFTLVLQPAESLLCAPDGLGKASSLWHQGVATAPPFTPEAVPRGPQPREGGHGARGAVCSAACWVGKQEERAPHGCPCHCPWS